MTTRTTYRSPHLIIYGSIQDVSRAFGTKDVEDTIFNSNGTVRGEGSGSGSSDDAVVQRRPTTP